MVWNGALGAFPTVYCHPGNADSLGHCLLAKSGFVSGPAHPTAESRDADSHIKPRFLAGPVMSLMIISKP